MEETKEGIVQGEKTEAREEVAGEGDEEDDGVMGVLPLWNLVVFS